jgi:hypothetical protein
VSDEAPVGLKDLQPETVVEKADAPVRHELMSGGNFKLPAIPVLPAQPPMWPENEGGIKITLEPKGG